MKKLFSIILMAALLVTCIAPALYSSAADVPSFVVAENTEYDENAGTVDVSFGIADNSGISEMTVLVYYIGDEMSIAGVTNGDYFEASEGGTGDSTSAKFKKYFQAPEFEENVVYKVTEVDLFSTADGDETGNGTIFNVTFNLDGNHAAGAEFTYGIKVKSASNAAGDDIVFSGKQEGKVTSLPDPYKAIYENFTVFTTETTVTADATEATVDLRLVNNPGINGMRVFIVYNEELNMTALEPVDGIFSVANEEFAPSSNKHASPDVSPSSIEAFNRMGLPTEGKVCATLVVKAATNSENRTASGVLARLTFALPEGMQQGDSFPIDFCWTEGDVLQAAPSTGGAVEPIILNPDHPTCYIKVATCDHPNVVLEVVKEATCSETGLKSGVCPDCGQTVEEVIAKLEHVAADEPVIVDPTCTEAGKIQTVCSVCGEVIVSVEDPDHPALGHDTENATEKITKEATCTETGLKDIICGRCGEAIEKDVVIPMKDHTPGEPVIVPPTCANGGAAGRIIISCTVCGAEISNEVDPDNPDPLQHVAGAPVVTKPATCQEEGSQDIFCTVCEEKIGTEVIAKLDHVEATERVEPTCTEDGVVIVTCSVCGEELSRTVLPKLGHVAADEPVIVPPTCVEDGKIQIVCSVCGEVISEAVDEENPATGIHTPGEPEIIEPTATEDGSITIKCSVCGEVISQVKVPATGVVTTDNKKDDTTTVIPSAPSDTTKAPVKNTDKAPTTGDNMVYVIVVAALAVVGCAAVVVIRKRKVSDK